MATLAALKTWYESIPKETKLTIYGVGTLVAFSGLILRGYYRNQQLKAKIADNNNNADPNQVIVNLSNAAPNNEIIIPLSRHKSFWGSYLLSSCTAALIFSTRFASFCNKYIPRIMSHKFTKSFTELLPPIPKTLSASFKLGQLESQLSSTTDPNKINQILSSASQILGETINAKQLKSILGQIHSIENQQTKLQRLRGVFRFVNIMWGISIFGICITVLPVTYYIGKPIWDEIYNTIKRFLISVAEILKKLLFNETAYTIYEIMGYIISWYCMYLGSESDGNSTIGFFTSLTGLGLWLTMLLGVSRIRHDPNHNIGGDVGLAMTEFFASILCGSMAYKFNNTKLGFLSVGSAYAYLCSVLYGQDYGIVEFFFDGDLTGIGVTVSMIFNTGLVMMKLRNVDIKPYQAFISPLCIFGCAGVYSALLTYSWEYGSWWYYNRNRLKSIDYFGRQYTMILSLITGAGLGNTLNLPAMSNTAYVYTFFYIIQKMIEYKPFWNGINGYFTIFTSSIVTWRLALYLHKNPQIFTRMIAFQ